MEIQFESRLLDGVGHLNSQHIGPKPSQTLDHYTLQNPTSFRAIERIAICPGSSSLVAAHLPLANHVILMDTKNLNRREKFPLKAADKRFSRQSFTCKGMDFSPDGSRLVVGQTDCVIYIYKLANQIGQSSESKPAITGKFTCSSPITCLRWIEQGIVFGTQDGKVKLISITNSSKQMDGQKSNSAAKVTSIYSPPMKAQMPLSLAVRGSSLLAVGFVDGTIALTLMDQIAGPSANEPATRSSSHISNCSMSIHSSSVIYLSFLPNDSLCCAASDGKIVMLSCQPETGSRQTHNQRGQLINYKQTHCIDLKEDLVSLDYSAINEVLAAVTSTRVAFIKLDSDTNQWQLQGPHLNLLSSVSLTSVRWTRDGSQLLVGTLLGSIEVMGCSWSKQSVGELLDVCHIARNRIRIIDKARNLLSTYRTQYDIKRVNLLNQGQGVIIWTTSSLLLAQLANYGQQSEISWSYRSERNVKFSFNNPGFVIIHNYATRQLKVIKLGENSVLYSVKLDSYLNDDLVSARRYPMPIELSPKDSRRSSLRRSSNLNNDNSGQIDTESSKDHESKSLVSIQNSERLAYVIEGYQLVVVDLKSGLKEMVLDHVKKIEKIKFCFTSSKLILVDADATLHLIDLEKPKESRIIVLMKLCDFADWCFQGDILVAQSKQDIKIWYNIQDLKRVDCFDSRSFNLDHEKPMIDLSFASMRGGSAYPKVSKISSDYQIHLSNGQTFELDKLRINFYTDLLAGQRLSKALESLEREAPVSEIPKTAKYSTLWSQLGWRAIQLGDLEVALRVFQSLGHRSLVKYLEDCASCDQLDTRRRRLAQLQGDWQTFEQITDQQDVIATYRRLNRWSQLIDYLNRAQQFRLRDLAEQDMRRWFIASGRILEGAEIQAKNGDLLGAIQLLMDKSRYQEAADLFVRRQTSPIVSAKTQLETQLVDLASELRFKLMNEAQDKGRAAMICDKILANKKEAINLYLADEQYELALELAQKQPTNLVQIDKIKVQYAEQMLKMAKDGKLNRARGLQAVDMLAKSGRELEALEVAVSLRLYDKALGIFMDQADSLDKLEPDRLASLSEVLGNLMLNKGDREAAIKIFEVGGKHERVFELLVESGKFKDAYEMAMKQGSGSNIQTEIDLKFKDLARQYEDKGQFESAEQIYLMLDKPELAIDLHKIKSKNYERMLELVSDHAPDLLEGSLLQLARQCEEQGDFGSAERYLMRASASEWVNVVRMYRLAGLWQDAYRVARANCASDQDPLLVQLAYWWAKSLNDLDKARALLVADNINCLSQVIEFCCENKNFNFAMELSKGEPGQLHLSVRRRFAAHLESERNLRKAEEVLVGGQLVEEACEMYLDNDLPLDAIRVAESRLSATEASRGGGLEGGQRDKLVALLNRTLIQCADKLLSQADGSSNDQRLERLAGAQQLLLRAQRPDLAVNLYKERGMWKEALQVAQRFAPQLLESVEMALDQKLAQDLSSRPPNGGPKTAEPRKTPTELRSANGTRADGLGANNRNSQRLKTGEALARDTNKSDLSKFLDSLIEEEESKKV